jgi:hypothetical protein
MRHHIARAPCGGRIWGFRDLPSWDRFGGRRSLHRDRKLTDSNDPQKERVDLAS